MKTFMKFSSFLLLVLCFSKCVNSDLNDEQAACASAGFGGACVPLAACARYVALLKNPATTLAGLQVTSARKCGFDGLNNKVCCPIDETPPTPAPTDSTPPPDDEDFVAAFPKPGECGIVRADRFHIEGGPFYYPPPPPPPPPPAYHYPPPRPVTSPTGSYSQTPEGDQQNTSGGDHFTPPPMPASNSWWPTLPPLPSPPQANEGQGWSVGPEHYSWPNPPPPSEDQLETTTEGSYTGPPYRPPSTFISSGPPLPPPPGYLEGHTNDRSNSTRFPPPPQVQHYPVAGGMEVTPVNRGSHTDTDPGSPKNTPETSLMSPMGATQKPPLPLPPTPPIQPPRPISHGHQVHFRVRRNSTRPPPLVFQDPIAGGSEVRAFNRVRRNSTLPPPLVLEEPIAGGSELLAIDREFKPGSRKNSAKATTTTTTPKPTRPPSTPRPIAGGQQVYYRGPMKTPVNNRPVAGLPVVAGGNPVFHRDTNSSDEVPTIPPPAISGGFPVDTRDMALWMALLGYNNSAVFWKCGGSIISARHVLTAAHCIKPNLYIVRVGELDLASDHKDHSPVDFLVKKAIAHPDYTKFHNDIGVVVLQGTIDFANHPHIAPVCLPADPKDVSVEKLLSSTSGLITGWGETEKVGERPNHLLYTYVNILGNDHCARAYADRNVTIDARVVCAGDAGSGADACNGDSGGPLSNKLVLPDPEGFFFKTYYFQLGVISYGFRCSYKRYAGVYTNVTHYMPWLEEQVLGRRVHWASG